MINQIIELIGKENLEKMALEWHVPQNATYVIVNENKKSYKVIKNKDKIHFNTKYRGMDYYSNVVTMNKVVKSKLISSCNYFSFFVKNVDKLKDEDVINYFQKLETPQQYLWHMHWIIDNIKELGRNNSGLIKIFFPGTREEYREQGLKNWYEKSITFQNSKQKKGGLAFPISINANPKKPFETNFKPYLVDNEKGLEIKILYDILKGMYKNGNNMLIVNEEKIISTRPDREGSYCSMPGGILIAYDLDKNGNVRITHMDNQNI